ncbi:MAG: YbaB/EbfC family nucleoid-associated protein [Clostridia bacterium]
MGANKFGGFGGGMGNMQQLMKQAQQMQEKLKEAQEELEESQVEGTSGGGMITVTCNGKKVISGIKLNPAVVDPDDIEMLEDLLVAGINDAYNKADELEEEMMAPFAAMKGLL